MHYIAYNTLKFINNSFSYKILKICCKYLKNRAVIGTCVCVCVFVCMCVFVCVCVYACACVYIRHA